MKRAAGWIFSGEGVTNEQSQRETIEKYCKAHDLLIEEWLTGSIGDVAYGDWMHGKRYDAVVVADSGYVSGDIFEFYAYKSVLRRRHSDLVAVESAFAGNELYRRILGKMIDTICEVDLRNEPLKKVSDRTDKVARGAYIGGRAPMGYRIADGQLEVNEEEAGVVRFIIERKRRGKSMLSTVDALNTKGYRTRNGKPFVISTVQGIWNNEMFYKGYRKYGDGEWVRGMHKPIVSE